MHLALDLFSWDLLLQWTEAETRLVEALQTSWRISGLIRVNSNFFCEPKTLSGDSKGCPPLVGKRMEQILSKDATTEYELEMQWNRRHISAVSTPGSSLPQKIPLLNRQNSQRHRESLMPRHALHPCEPIHHTLIPTPISSLQSQQLGHVAIVPHSTPRGGNQPRRKRQRIPIRFHPLEHAVPEHGAEPSAQIGSFA